jgi:hypothetical protein
MDIRKIAVGPDYKSGAMHYIVGQKVLNDNYCIHLIKYNENKDSFQVWIERADEVILWKEFTSTIPISVEYNIYFQ